MKRLAPSLFAQFVVALQPVAQLFKSKQGLVAAPTCTC